MTPTLLIVISFHSVRRRRCGRRGLLRHGPRRPAEEARAVLLPDRRHARGPHFRVVDLYSQMRPYQSLIETMTIDEV